MTAHAQPLAGARGLDVGIVYLGGGRGLLNALVERADVLVASFALGTMDEFGLGSDHAVYGGLIGLDAAVADLRGDGVT